MAGPRKGIGEDEEELKRRGREDGAGGGTSITKYVQNHSPFISNGSIFLDIRSEDAIFLRDSWVTGTRDSDRAVDMIY